MKRVNHLYSEIISFENILSASKKARKGKRYKASTAFFEFNLEKNNKNKSRVYKTTDGVDFLGYRIFPDHTLVRKSTVKAYRKKMKKMAVDYKNGSIQLHDVNQSIQSWICHVKHADSYRIRKELLFNAVFCRN